MKIISTHCESNRSSYQVVNFARTIISIIALDLVLTYVTLHSWKLNWYINNKLSNNNKQLFFAKNQQKLRQKIILNWRSKIIVRKIRLLSSQNLVLSKGQLISKCLFGVIVSTKIPTKKIDNFCPSS